jgi:hypothetical protein
VSYHFVLTVQWRRLDLRPGLIGDSNSTTYGYRHFHVKAGEHLILELLLEENADQARVPVDRDNPVILFYRLIPA